MEKQRRAGVLTLTLSCSWGWRPAPVFPVPCVQVTTSRAVWQHGQPARHFPACEKSATGSPRPSVSREGGTPRAQSQSQCPLRGPPGTGPPSTAHFPRLTESTQDRHDLTRQWREAADRGRWLKLTASCCPSTDVALSGACPDVHPGRPHIQRLGQPLQGGQ